MKAPALERNRAARARDPNPLAELYRVNIEWLTGAVPLRDYAHVEKMDGAHRLTFNDRDIIAEFAASLPRGIAKQLPDPDGDSDAKA